ncbi:MAG: EF-hand domain-containing protein [Xylophilus ampelinus]
MTTIGSVGGAGSAWASAIAQRTQRSTQMSERLLSKLDADGSGNVNGTELQGLLDDVSKKTGTERGTRAADLIEQFDADGSGSLDAAELGNTLQSVLPPPPSTMAFAQSRGDTADSKSSDSGGSRASSTSATGRAGDDLYGKVDGDGDGAVSKAELQDLLDKMSGGTASQAGVSSDELFGQLDTDGDGSLSQAEFDADRPAQDGQASGSATQAMGGMPPPPGGPGGPGGPPPGGAAGKTEDSSSSSSSSSSSTATTYDPLDTNEDGVVSAAERLAGASASQDQDAIEALFKSIDTDGDSTISATESQSFVDQLTSRLQQSTTSAASASSSSESENGSSGPRMDLSRLADMARRLYETNTGTTASSSGISDRLSALA